jgi:hypothetical protein
MFRAGLDIAMMRAAALYAIPVVSVAAVDRRHALLGNGTAFMLDCGQGPFLVTAAHVAEGFRQDRARHADAVFLVGDVRFDFEGRRIDADPARDVATFRLEPGEVRRLGGYANGKAVLTGSQKSWPPAPPDLDRSVFFVGFPGDGGTLRPYRGGGVLEIDWCGYTALAVADGMSDTDVTLVLDHDRNLDIEGRPRIPEDWALGGCSGAPLLTFVDHGGVFSWRLAGVVYEAGGMFVKAARADCLRPDGKLVPFPNPMAYRPRPHGDGA